MFLHVLFILISVPLFNSISFNTTEVRNHFEKVRLRCLSSLSLYPVWPVFRKQNKTAFCIFPPSLCTNCKAESLSACPLIPQPIPN